VIQYISFNKKGLSDNDIRNLLNTPRYSFVNHQRLLEVHSTFNEYLPKLFIDAIMYRMCLQNSLPIPSHLYQYPPRSCYALFFCQPQNEYDRHGLFHWLGKNRGFDDWTNPVSRGLVALSSSSSWGNAIIPESLCGSSNQVTIFWTNSEPDAWVKFDIDPKNLGLRFIITHYLYEFQASMWIPRSWNLEGSLNNTDWVVLKEHNNDITIKGPGSYIFPVTNSTEAFRYFRLHITGPDTTGTSYIGISSIELYGRVSGK